MVNIYAGNMKTVSSWLHWQGPRQDAILQWYQPASLHQTMTSSTSSCSSSEALPKSGQPPVTTISNAAGLRFVIHNSFTWSHSPKRMYTLQPAFCFILVFKEAENYQMNDHHSRNSASLEQTLYSLASSYESHFHASILKPTDKGTIHIFALNLEQIMNLLYGSAPSSPMRKSAVLQACYPGQCARAQSASQTTPSDCKIAASTSPAQYNALIALTSDCPQRHVVEHPAKYAIRS